MLLKELKADFHQQLSDYYPSEEVGSFFSLLSEFYLKISRLEAAISPDLIISESISEKYKMAILRLQKQEPIQYILGETEFYGFPIKVTPDTLIPRPETEELVKWVIGDAQLLKPEETKAVLDIGTGSGCIAIAVAKHLPNTRVTAIDISEKALTVAKENAPLNGVSIQFEQQDILSCNILSDNYDIIISNPPYVRESEKEKMQQNVLAYEPASALFVKDEDPLLFYRKIAAFAKIHLTPRGNLYLEINEYLSKKLTAMLKSMGFKQVEVRKDLFGKDRMIKCALHETTE
jgi:release factor glutamine methyltransferase